MSEQSLSDKLEAKLELAYRNMMQRVESALQHAKQDTLPSIQTHIDAAVDKAIELEELGEEEARKLGTYLQRDLQDAAQFLADTGQGLRDWMRFDLDLIEDRLLDMFSTMVDHTQEELTRLELEAQANTVWQAGEITGPGALCCDNCGTVQLFHSPAQIVPCANCQHTAFTRVWDDEPDTSSDAEQSPPADTQT